MHDRSLHHALCLHRVKYTIHTHTAVLRPPLYATTRVGRYQKLSFWILRGVGNTIVADNPTGLHLIRTTDAPTSIIPPVLQVQINSYNDKNTFTCTGIKKIAPNLSVIQNYKFYNSCVKKREANQWEWSERTITGSPTFRTSQNFVKQSSPQLAK